MFFNGCFKKRAYIPVKLNNTIIPETKKHKFLGIYLTPTLKWTTHINYINLAMSKHREHLKKLGHDVQTLEKKLEQVLREDGESIHKGGKMSANKMPIKHSPRHSSVQKMCDHRKIKGKPRASVEVTVKTKCSGKTKTNKTKSIAPVSSVLSNLSANNKLESHHTPEPSYSKSSTKNKGNLMWGNILKNSVIDSTHAVTNTKVDEVAVKESKMRRNEKVGELDGCPNCKNLVSGRSYLSDGGGKVTAANSISSLDHETACQAGMKNSNFGIYLSDELYSEMGHRERLGSKNCSGMNPIEKLGILLQELNKKLTVEDESMRMLAGKMQSTLGNLVETMSAAGFYSGKSPLMVRRLSSRRMFEQNSKLTEGNEIKENVDENAFDTPKSQKQKFVCEKNFEIPVKMVDDKEIQVNLSLDIDEKLKLEVEDLRNFEDNVLKIVVVSSSTLLEMISEILNSFFTHTLSSSKKYRRITPNCDVAYHTVSVRECSGPLVVIQGKLDLQLKSVNRVTAKESEYQSLLVSLLDKVKNLEDQVMEQRKGTDHFLLQNNVLKEQNTVIPVLQASQDLLQKRLLQILQDYENLKVDYHLLKLEKEKYCALNDAKDKEIKWFQDEISVPVEDALMTLMELLKWSNLDNLVSKDLVSLVKREEDFYKLDNLSVEYMRAAGTKLNKEKSNGLWCGSWRYRTDTPMGLQWATGVAKYRGVWLGNDTQQVDDSYTEISLKRLENGIQKWGRIAIRMSIKGRVAISNQFLALRLWHALQIWTPNKETISQMQKLLTDFMWGNRSHWMRANMLCSSITDGGLGLVNISDTIRAFCILFAQRFVTGNPCEPWKMAVADASRKFRNLGHMTNLFL
ncbi:hypothetical protein J437_LFUL017612 [Ladona fulva]|uniref:Uncharacterized protein n=1 Tax=Ladona fulva TaxID=123851 RepID=A0A8K0PAN3_LADFU|nr:hypothetical protein J437_LFUL017612 [Ladona fulva]